MDEAAALRLVEEKLASGADPVEVLEECRRGMSAVGERFEKGEMYLSELFMASEIFNQITARVKPLLGKAEQRPGQDRHRHRRGRRPRHRQEHLHIASSRRRDSRS